MSYPNGPPPGHGYSYGYGPPVLYPPPGPPQQQQYGSSNNHHVPHGQVHPHGSWDGTLQGMSLQQTQHISHNQQQQQAPAALQAQNQAAYYQQQQYGPVSGMPPPRAYAQVAPPSQQHYPQYVTPPQQPLQISQYEHHPAANFQIQIPQQQRQMTSLPSDSNKPSQPSRSRPPQPSTSNSPAPQKHGQVKSEPRSQVKVPAPSQPPDPAMLLISLAEEYFEAAYTLGPSVARGMSEDLVEEYQKLIATGLGCLEASFKKMRLAPRLEAKVRLRYAGVLFEETENHMEAETALSQGIILCEQNRYLDIKYCMQVLLAQLVFVKNPKASLKSLERHCADSEAYRHHAWEYVFRFLRASLSMKSNKSSDTQAAIHDLHYISSLSNECGDRAIFLLSSLMEILAHLSSPSAESPEQIQAALAAAWTYQMDEASRNPQLLVLTHILDVTCSLIYGLPPQTEAKQKELELAFRNSAWSSSLDFSDVIAVPINSTKGKSQLVSQDTRGILSTSESGKDALMVSFLNNNDTFALIYLLSGIALLHNNSGDGKAAQYLKQGLQSVLDSNKSPNRTGPLPGIMAKSQWRDVLTCYFLVYSALCSASSSEWNTAQEYLETLSDAIGGLEEEHYGILSHFCLYLSGMCYQGTGDLENALKTFRDPKLRLEERPGPNIGPEEQVRNELGLLASLNSLWILQADEYHNASQNSASIAKLEPLCANHPNRDIETAFKLIKATVDTEPPTSGVNTKGFLGSSLEAAKSTSNKQFLCITLAVMCHKFFHGVVGTQADKAGKAAVFQAKRARSTLWLSVTHGMLAENLELQGKHTDAQATKAEARRLAAVAFPDPEE